MKLKERIESEGRAPVLGWCDNRKVPVNLYKTDIKQTWRLVQEFQKFNKQLVNRK